MTKSFQFFHCLYFLFIHLFTCLFLHSKEHWRDILSSDAWFREIETFRSNIDWNYNFSDIIFVNLMKVLESVIFFPQQDKQIL